MPISRQSFSYRLNTLYTRSHLVERINNKGALIEPTSNSFILTPEGEKCFGETKQTLVGLLLK